MIDPLGFDVRGHPRARASYEAALRPLGLTLRTELDGDSEGAPACGFGREGAGEFWIAGDHPATGAAHRVHDAGPCLRRRLPCRGSGR